MKTLTVQSAGVLAAVAPIVGIARVASAIDAIADALDVVIEADELNAQNAS